MSERNPGYADRKVKSLTKREFLKLFTVGVFTLANYSKFRSLQGYLTDSEVSFLAEVKEAESLPADLYGVHFNYPYPWIRTPGQIDDFVKFVRETVPRQPYSPNPKYTIRILPDAPGNFIEKKLGVITKSQMEDLKGVIDYLPDDFQVILPVIDGYWIFRSNIANGMYPESPLNSVYLKDTSSVQGILKSQYGFFTGKDQKAAYKYRSDAFIETFGEMDKVLLEMGNEICMPLFFPGATHKNSEWYSEMYDYYRKKYKKTLFTGVPNPDFIDYTYFSDTEGLITTDHVYLPRLTPYPKKVPVVVEEVNVSSVQLGQEFENADGAMKHLLQGAVKNGIEDKVARVGCVIIWHGDKDHGDNLAVTNEGYPESLEYAGKLSLVLQNFGHRNPMDMPLAV